MATSTTPFRQWIPMDETPEEKAKRIGVPCIPAAAEAERSDRDPNPVIAVCGACGLECRKVMMYACQRNGCPIRGLKPTFHQA